MNRMIEGCDRNLWSRISFRRLSQSGFERLLTSILSANFFQRIGLAVESAADLVDLGNGSFAERRVFIEKLDVVEGI